MPIKTGVNTFDGGMNKDLADRLLPVNKYRDAQNFRLVTTKGGTSGNLENIKGNKFILDSIDASKIVDGKIIGSCELRDQIILFTTNNVDDSPSSTGSRIYILKIDLDTEEQISLELIYDDTLNVDNSPLNFSTLYPIKAIGKYETPHVQKVYWTDGYNNMRYMNVASNLTSSGEVYNVTTNKYMSVDKFEYLPKFTFSKPVLKNIVGGKLNTGMIAYAYQLYIINGAETSFSSLSDPISVVSDNDFLSDSRLYKGDETVTNSGKGFVMEIDNSDNIGYNRLRLVRVQYSYLNSVPEIYICNEVSISPAGSVINVTDVGDVLGTLTVDEFNLVSTELFSCQDIASKDNRLFVANIKKKEFEVDEWDARAVRFLHNSTATVIDSTEPSVTIQPDLSNWSDYVATHDGINQFNDPTKDGNASYAFKYQRNGTILGAEGLNIKIGFGVEDVIIDTSNDNTTFYVGAPSSATDLSYKSYASPWKGGKLSWQRDEIYRLFIVFGNDRGQLSDPRWICDLRMPSLHDSGYEVLGKLISTTVATTCLYPIVTLKSFPANATFAQIHRVKRERSDRSVVTQAVGVTTAAVDGSIYRPSINQLIPGAATLIKLMSPEINITKNISKQSNDYLEYVTWFQGYGTYSRTDGYNRSTLKQVINTLVPYSANNKAVINDAVPVSPAVNDTSVITIDNKAYNNYYTNYKEKGGSGLLVSYVDSAWPSTYVLFPIVNYKANVYGSQYGGYTYEDRMVNVSIPCSDVITYFDINSPVNVRYGDTFINYFDVSLGLYDLAQNSISDTYTFGLYVPLESSINCDLRYDTSSTHLTYPNTLASLRQEYSGTHVMDNGRTYVQDYNMYSYNTVYSQQMDIRPAISLSVDKILETEFDTMIKSSNKKSNGEITDSWTKFGVNEFIEVDSIYGPVTSITNFNNRLFFHQDKGFGLLSVNDRSIVQDASSAKIVLGTGGILDRYDYISILCGGRDKFSVICGDTGLFWFDRVNNYIIKYSDNIDKVSLSKGMQSYFTDNVSSVHKVIGMADKNNNEILYTFFDDNLPSLADSFTLAYSENIDTFISFYTVTPSIYIPYKNRYLTTTSDKFCDGQFDLDYLFIHDSALYNRCNFYSLPGGYGYFYDSTLNILFNQDYLYTKAWDNIFYLSSTYDLYGTELYNQTIDTIRCYNTYQNTDYVNLTYGYNLMRRERSWSFDVPRNVVTENLTTNPNIFTSDLTDTTRLFRERLKDKHMSVDFIYNNNATRDKLVLGNVACKYRISYR